MGKRMTDSDSSTPSLLEPQSRGGEIAEGGFSFQDHVILARIPEWLAQEGFTAMIKEATGDIEAKYFVPGQDFTKDLIEVKDHTLQPAEFWQEIKRFQEVDAGSPGTYRRFTLIGAGASKELQPILHGLKRVQNSQDFYDEQDAVKSNSIQEYIQLIEAKEHSRQDALFLLAKVTVETDWNTAKSQGEAIFKQTLVERLDEFGDLPGRILDDIYNHLSTLIRRSSNRSISRKELETELREKIPIHQQPAHRPILIYTAIDPEDNPLHPGLRFDWTRFSGGETRAIAPAQEWDQLVIDLQETRTWIENHRNIKRIKLLGNRRVSACLAIGSVFSAVRGYAIDMEYRDEIWSTDAHSTPETPVYPLAHRVLEEKGDRLVVSINIHRNTLPEVQANLKRLELVDSPILDIQGEQPIMSPEHANQIVSQLKRLIVQCLQPRNCKEIHLFYTGPAHLALFLGHRLDATAPVICYGWVENRQYSRTCQLLSK